MTRERAILAGGCFWGMEDLIRRQTGVLDTTVGYTGGSVKNPTYERHDGHTEAIEIIFDSSVISYRTLLEFFFQIHDPTTKNRQGNDIGTSYRSAIFYLDEAQKTTAEQLIKEIDASKKWGGKIVTEITPASEFYTAEGYHQDYLQHYPNGYTCHFIRPDWKLR
jgi:peptide-methionine (S)-S-oxide reductase